MMKCVVILALCSGGSFEDSANGVEFPFPTDRDQSVELIRTPEILVELEYASVVSPADDAWVAVSFTNLSTNVVEIKSAHYRIESVRFDPATGDRVLSGGLASGNTYDLFHEAWDGDDVHPRNRRRRSPILIEPGRSLKIWAQPTQYSRVLLAHHLKRSLRIEATAHIRFEIAGGDGEISTPLHEGVSFSFDWKAATDDDIRQMQDELRHRLQHIGWRVADMWSLHFLFSTERIAREVSLDELLAGLTVRSGWIVGGRESIAKYIGEHFGNDPLVIDWYALRLNEGDVHAAVDLWQSKTWDRALIPALSKFLQVERDIFSRGKYALDVLHRHRDEWIDDPEIVNTLAEAIRQHLPILDEPITNVGDDRAGHWADAIEKLAMTGDISVLSLAVPALDDRRMIGDIPRNFDNRLRVLPPIRVCDAALDAIFAVQYGAARLGYPEYEEQIAAVAMIRDDLEREKAFMALRDDMIEDLKHALGDADN